MPAHTGTNPGVSGLSPEARHILASAAKVRGGFRLYPTSFAQERFWLFDRMEPGKAVYNVPSALEVTGALQVNLLEEAVNHIIQRHEVLRTTFILSGSAPMQVVWERMPVAFETRELYQAQEIDREEKIRDMIRLAATRAFSLESGPLFRVLVIGCGFERQLLLFTMHHIIFDEWSRAILLREIAAIYGALACKETPSLPPVRIQYADYAAWQRRRMQGTVMAQLEEFWKAALEGIPDTLDLPTDSSPPLGRNYEGNGVSFTLPTMLATKARALAQEQGATPFMLVLAVYATLLHRYSAQHDIVIGTPIAARERTDVESLMGCLVNTLVMRVRYGQNTSFLELLTQVKEYALKAYAHSELPFEKLVELLQPKRTRSHAPLFQASLTFLNIPRESTETPGLTLRRVESDTGTVGLDLMLFVTERGPDFFLSLKYSCELFDRSTAERMTEHFVTLLQSAVMNPAQKISELDFLTSGDRKLVLSQSHVLRNLLDDTPLVHRRSAENAELCPNAVAAIFGETKLSRSELNAKANRLAHYLKALGVQPESIVGVCLEDTFETLVAILAIWKAGAAYLPLDPAYPAERLAFLMEDTALALIVSQEELSGVLPSTPAYVVLLDAHADAIESEPTVDPNVELHPLNAAYIIYTSGSTGKPKGVVISHHGLRNLVTAEKTLLGLDTNSRVLKFASLNFDASVWEMAGALNAGATLCLAKREHLMPGNALHNTIHENQISHVTLPPAVLTGMQGALPASVRTLVSAGEPCTKQIVERHSIGRKLINAYGPTENTVCATAQLVDSLDKPTIGSPILNVRVFVVDRKLQAVPAGVPGELLLGGDSLARGYWNRPDLTAERFVPNPFVPTEGERLYRTGDLVRWRTDGTLIFLGRLDEQIKIRGFRIEPAEVEGVMRTHPDVWDCAVRAADGASPNLVAYVVMKNEADLDPEGLLTYLRERLPEQMVPSGFIALDTIPLTNSGKIDRKALPKFEDSYSRSGQYEPPASATEEILAAIWSQVLQTDRIGRHDNYFTMGGDSMRAVQISAKAQERGLPVAVHHLFQAPTVAALAKSVEQSAPTVRLQDSAPFCMISDEDRGRIPSDIEDAFPLTPLQMGMAFHADYSAGTAVYHDVFSFYLRVPFDHDRLKEAYQQLIDAHPALRTRFDFVSFSEPLQLVENHRLARIAVYDLRDLEGDAQEQTLAEWFETEKQTPIDLATESFRVVVHLCSELTFQISIGLHHANSDGWSGATLLSELFLCYEALLGSETFLLPKPESTYREFVLLTLAISEDEAAIQFWRDKLNERSGAPLLRWRLDTHREECETTAYPIPLSKELSDSVLALSRDLAVPVKSVLLAAHLKVISMWNVAGEATSGLSTSGRPERADGERVIGLFLNTVPIRTEMHDESWADLIVRVYGAERDIIPFRRFPLAQMQKIGAKAPLFDVSFNFIHFHVFRRIAGLSKIEVLQTRSFAATNLPLLTMFLMDPHSDQLRQSIFYSPVHFSPEQVQALAATYHAVFHEMLNHPSSNHLATVWNHPELQQSNKTFWNSRAGEIVKVSLRPDLELTVAFDPIYLQAEYELQSSAGLGPGGSDSDTMCLAAWFALLFRYTGQEKITLLAKTNDVTAPVTCVMPAGTTLRMLAEQVGSELHLAKLHQSLPDHESVEDIYGALPIGFGALDSDAELTIALRSGPSRLWLRYDGARYSSETAHRILTHMVSVLDQFARHWELPLSDIRLVSSGETEPGRRHGRPVFRATTAPVAQ